MTSPPDIRATRLSYAPSRLKHGLFLLLAAGFVAMGVWIVTHARAGDAWIGWANIVFFGLGAVLFARQLQDTRPRLVLDADGVLDRSLKLGVIPWDAIDGAYLQRMHGQPFICLELHDAAPWLARMSRVARTLAAANVKLGFQPLNLNLSGLKADPAVVLDAVLAGAAAARLARD